MKEVKVIEGTERWVWRKQVTCCCMMWIRGPETAAMFGKSCSGCCWPLLWRIPILIWITATIVWSFLEFWGPIEMWFLYMTHWGLLIIFVQSFLGVIVGINSLRGKLLDDTTYKLPTYVKMYWTCYNMAIPIAFLITFFYWILLRGSYPSTYKSSILTTVNPTNPAEKFTDAITTTALQSVNTESFTDKNEINTENLRENLVTEDNNVITATDPIFTDENEVKNVDGTLLITYSYSTITVSSTLPENDTVDEIKIKLKRRSILSVIDKDARLEVSSIEHRKLLMYSPDPVLDYFIHAVNSVVMFFELITAAHPSRLLHIWQPVMVAGVYMLMGVAYYGAGGMDPAGNPWIYPMIDWSKPEQALLVTFLCAVYLCLVHMVVVIIATIRDKIARKYRPKMDSLVFHDSCKLWSWR